MRWGLIRINREKGKNTNKWEKDFYNRGYNYYNILYDDKI